MTQQEIKDACQKIAELSGRVSVEAGRLAKETAPIMRGNYIRMIDCHIDILKDISDKLNQVL